MERRPKFLDELRTMLDYSSDDEARLLNSLSWQVFKKGHVIDGQNEILANLFYIHRGAARTYYIERGKEFNYAFSFEGEFVIRPLSMMQKQKLQMFVQFLSETEICYTPVVSLSNAILSSEEYSRVINAALERHIEYLEEHMFMLRMEARDRYFWALKKYPHILDVVSVTQLASFLNLTKETLYRIRSGKY